MAYSVLNLYYFYHFYLKFLFCLYFLSSTFYIFITLVLMLKFPLTSLFLSKNIIYKKLKKIEKTHKETERMGWKLGGWAMAGGHRSSIGVPDHPQIWDPLRIRTGIEIEGWGPSRRPLPHWFGSHTIHVVMANPIREVGVWRRAFNLFHGCAFPFLFCFLSSQRYFN